MRNIIFYTFFLITILMHGQSSCNPTVIPNQVFYPNSTSTPSVYFDTQYLCGPNTIVYDTIANDCRTIYVNPGCTLIFDKSLCMSVSIIYLKNNSTFIVSTASNLAIVHKEPLATIVNTVSATIQTINCTSISFPTLNCIQTGFTNSSSNLFSFNISPNPSSTKLNIELSNSIDNKIDIYIKNETGQLVKEFLQITSDEKEIPINDLPNGCYFVILQTPSFSQMRRLIVIR